MWTAMSWLHSRCHSYHSRLAPSNRFMRSAPPVSQTEEATMASSSGRVEMQAGIRMHLSLAHLFSRRSTLSKALQGLGVGRGCNL